MSDFNNEISKYRKKKGSSTSKSNIKSKHKHEYSKCLIIEKDKPYKATYCKICGKIGDVWFFVTKPCGIGYSRTLTDEEVYERYGDLERFEVDTIFQKFVDVSK